eukprot:GSChrysophyteH2.ASY1.ANO1.64.1 assembled CDS
MLTSVASQDVSIRRPYLDPTLRSGTPPSTTGERENPGTAFSILTWSVKTRVNWDLLIMLQGLRPTLGRSSARVLSMRNRFPSTKSVPSVETIRSGRLSIRSYSASRRNENFNIFGNFKLVQSQAALDTNFRTNTPVQPQQLMEFLTLANKTNPRQAAALLEKGWQNQLVPVNEITIREYIKSAAALNRLHTINITGLLQLLNKSTSDPAKAEAMLANAMKAGQVQMGVGGAGGMGGMVGAGGTPENPLFVSRTTFQTGWQKVGNVVGSVVRLAIFVVLASAVYGMVSEGGGGGMGGVASKSPVHIAENPDKKFEDVVGVDEAKLELEEIVKYLADPAGFTKLGGKMPNGVLLTGKPGTGKTLLAKAVAEMFVGVGASRVRKLFATAREKAPCIIFIDEIDAIGSKRSGKSEQYSRMTLNELLVQMDGFDDSSGIVVIAATNLANVLDPALTRPGRLDKLVDVPLPDIGGREKILDLYCKKVKTNIPHKGVAQLARGTPGFSPAQLENLVNQAAVHASTL